MKILLLSPHLKYKGGVSTFNSLLLKYCKIDLTLFAINSNRKISFYKPFFLTADYINFIYKLIKNSYDIIHINPSLSKNSIRRDSIYIIISKLFGKKVFIQWHGWNNKNEYLLKDILFRRAFYKVDHIRFLTSESRDKFINSGFKNITSLGNTFVDDDLLQFSHSKNIISGNKIKILFLSRVTKEKGIFIALKAFELASRKIDNLFLTIAGDGADLESAMKYVIENSLSNVEFIGRVEDKAKVNVFSKSHIYILPSYTEGMPISLLEAMLFGNIILTSDAGGIKDFFESKKMGYMIDSDNPIEYYHGLIKIINFVNHDSISCYNSNFIKKKYLASTSILEIEKIYNQLI